MDLEKFVTETMRQVFKGLEGARQSATETGYQLDPKPQHLKDGPYRYAIDFDVAVTTTDSEQSKGGAGIMVAGVFAFGGQKTADTVNMSISRIKFSVPFSRAR